jgi:hypothetical protein
MNETIETLRPELTKLPEYMQALPVFRGYPVPWFVAYPNGPEGEPEFRLMDREKWIRAVQQKVCWVCGQKLGSHLAFVLGPMCGITRTTSEPACHRVCAEWSAANCPFLARPHMVRRENDLPEAAEDAPGLHRRRNPSVTLLWMTRTFSLFRAQDRRYLIHVGDPIEVLCYAEGQKATRQEVDESVAGGLPSLIEAAKQDGSEAERELARQVEEFEFYLPAR